VLLVGHNPTLEETVATLCNPQVAETERWTEGWGIKIPTAGLVCLNFEITDWTDLEPGEGVLQWFVIPKLMKALK
jgi:phosphohistidine phosphatase SixA